MVEATLKRCDDDLLSLRIDGASDETYLIPLATALTLDEAAEMKTEEGAKAFFCKYIPDEVTKTFKIGQWANLINLWRTASDKYANEMKDAALGES